MLFMSDANYFLFPHNILYFCLGMSNKTTVSCYPDEKWMCMKY